MVSAEIQIALQFDVYFVDTDSKEEAQELRKQLIKSLKGGRYLLPMLSNIHRCDYSNADIKLDVGKVILHDGCYMSVVEINIINKTTVDFEPYADVDFYDISADIFEW